MVDGDEVVVFASYVVGMSVMLVGVAGSCYNTEQDGELFSSAGRKFHKAQSASYFFVTCVFFTVGVNINDTYCREKILQKDICRM